MMRFKWIVLLLLLVLPIITANFDTVGNNNSLTIFDNENKQLLPRSHRLKRQCELCVGPPPPPPIIFVCCGASGLKEIFSSLWLNVSLLLLPMSVSWLESMFR